MKRLPIPGRLILASLMLGIIPGIMVASAAEPLDQRAERSDPAANMSAEQQEADHDRVWEAYQEKFAAWLTTATSGTTNFSTLARVDLQLLTDPPMQTLREAVRDADIIVVATVESVDFLPSHTAVVHLHVDRSLKGAADSDLTILQPGGPQPAGPDWRGMVLAQSDAEPLLLPGDRAILLIGDGGVHKYVQPHTGELRIDGNRVTPLDTNHARASIDGKTLSEVILLLLAEMN